MGTKLPNIADPDLPWEEKVLYKKAMMALFKPFRSSDEIPSAGEDMSRTFEVWWGETAGEDARRFSECSLDMYLSKSLEDSGNDPDLDYYDGCGDAVCFGNDGHVSSDDDDEFSGDDDGCSEDEDVARATDVDALNDTLQSRLLPSIPLSEATIKLAVSHVGSADILPTLSDVELDSGSVVDDLHSTDRGDPVCPTRVELCDAECLDPVWRPVSERNRSDDESRRDLRAVSEKFGLNRKQHKAFVVMGRALLTSFISDGGSGHDNRQLRAFVGGLPGAGKSQVIKAVQWLARAWQREQSVKTIAYQGIAAQVANGETIHKCFGWSLKADPRKWKPNRATLEEFAQVRMIILDEVSSTDVALIGRIDDCLRKCTGRDVFFGGIHFVFVGDWLQQLPVAGTPAYASQIPLSTNSSDYIYAAKGAAAYQSVNSVIILTENMRHQSNDGWKEILEKWRYANYEQVDLDRVNASCLIHPGHRVDEMTEKLGFCPIVVTSNALRVEFNVEGVRQHCLSHSHEWHRFPAVVTHRRGLTMSQLRRLRRIRDDKTGNLPMLLDVAHGMPVQCTKNVSKNLKLSNGSVGHICGIAFGENDETIIVQDPCSTMRIYYHSVLPRVLYVKLRGYEDVRFASSLPTGVVPVFPFKQKGVHVILPNRQFSIGMEQIPLVPAFSITADKSQGLTVDSMVLGPMCHPTRRTPQRTSFYVAVTRVKTVEKLFLTEPLTMERLSYFHPSPQAIAETERLQGEEGMDL